MAIRPIGCRRNRSETDDRTTTAGDLADVRGAVARHPDLIVAVRYESLVSRDHPIRLMKKVAEEASRRLGSGLGERYSERGLRAVPPEMLLKA